MAQRDLREWALKGAEQRLVEIAAEAARIYAKFPELRDQRHGRAEPHQSLAPRTRRRRSNISAEGRRRISEAQMARWARQRTPGGAPGPSKPKPAAKSRKNK